MSANPVQLVRSALERAGCDPRGGEGQFSARCPVPAHDDHSPSLSVGRGSDGRALVHCHRGCPVESVVGALGLTLHDLFPNDSNPDLEVVLSTIGPGPDGPLTSRNGSRPDRDPVEPVELGWRWACDLKVASEPNWLWAGYLAPSAVTILAGRPKSGKSTLATALAEALSAGERAFLGRPLRSGPVLYVSEEGAATLGPKLRGSRIRTLTREDAWPRPEWDALIEAASEEADRVGALAVVIDSLAFWGGLGEGAENDSGATQRVLAALGRATGAGLGVLLVHHQRKAPGEGGDAVRGSSAIFAATDALVELERVKDGGAPTQRALIAAGRWPGVPPVLVVDFHEGSWQAIGEAGDREAAGQFGVRQRILDALPSEPPGATETEIAEVLLDLDPRKVGKPLRELVDDGRVERVGGGKKGDPYRYALASKCSPQNAPPSVGEEVADGVSKILPSPYRGGGWKRKEDFSPPLSPPPTGEKVDRPASTDADDSNEAGLCACSEWTARRGDDSCVKCGRLKP